MGTKPNSNKNMNKKEQKPIPIEFRDTFYANGVRLTSSQYEFVLDFFQQPPQDNGRYEGFRIYLNPENFKLFTNLFKEQLEIFEEKIRKIKV